MTNDAEAKFLAACQADYAEVFKQPLPDSPSREFLAAICTTAMIASATFQLMHEREAAETGIKVCRSAAGYYLGRIGPEGPVDRDSEQYWREKDAASAALANGEWTSRSGLGRKLQRLGLASAQANARLAEIVALEGQLPERPKRGRTARPKIFQKWF
ncbi:hypothetical protein [Bradyrhizobium sp. USDA 336]|uniref:hypothetical protein n=1 Tax=Bradyrhizobium sp. USDA 336 TaxID=3156311 RepID=UPI00384CA887